MWLLTFTEQMYRIFINLETISQQNGCFFVLPYWFQRVRVHAHYSVRTSNLNINVSLKPTHFFKYCSEWFCVRAVIEINSIDGTV